MNILRRWFDHEYKELKRFGVLADSIEALSSEYSELSDEKLKAKTNEFKERLVNGEKNLPHLFVG